MRSSLTFEGHISQSCGADIHSVHSFLAGIRRLILSAAAWGIHPSPCMEIDAFIASPALNLRYTRLYDTLHAMGRNLSIERRAFVHRFIGTPQPPWSEGRLLSLPIRPFLCIAKRRTSSRYHSKGRSTFPTVQVVLVSTRLLE